MSQSGTVIGGYGQFVLNALRQGSDGRFNVRANVERVVLFVAHPITDDIRVYTEFEWENAGVCARCQGSAEVEQAYVQWRLAGELFALRVGLVLVPMGIINQWHEPPVFHGVERPMVDQLIIPTTWRELGVGFVGNWQQLLRYELYVTTTLNPMLLDQNGLGDATTMGSLAAARAFAVSGRAEVEPWLGVIAGASFFLSNTGPNGDYFDADHQRRHITLPVLGYALDARMRRAGFEARAVWAQFFLPNSDDLLTAFTKEGNPVIDPIMMGGGTVPGTHPRWLRRARLQRAVTHAAQPRAARLRTPRVLQHAGRGADGVHRQRATRRARDHAGHNLSPDHAARIQDRCAAARSPARLRRAAVQPRLRLHVLNGVS